MWYPIAFASWNLNVLCLASHLNRYRPGEKHCSGFLDGAFVAVFAYADCYTTDCCSVVPHTVTLRTLVSREIEDYIAKINLISKANGTGEHEEG
ncbi:hypothetical protein G5714_002554 [Onychostoma macrolepis]|uniref:Uncharacterized protein n=1 Tax=Onychostoma macrolepis TaxID=369639 RepID=A0A7J6D7Q2_9TELE|nr:hypothetical protein G5714_002554 [Onychostoma macrolepis]